MIAIVFIRARHFILFSRLKPNMKIYLYPCLHSSFVLSLPSSTYSRPLRANSYFSFVITSPVSMNRARLPSFTTPLPNSSEFIWVWAKLNSHRKLSTSSSAAYTTMHVLSSAVWESMTRNEQWVYPSLGTIFFTNQSPTCWMLSPTNGDWKAFVGLVAPLVIVDKSLLVMNATSSLRVQSSRPKNCFFLYSTKFSMASRKVSRVWWQVFWISFAWVRMYPRIEDNLRLQECLLYKSLVYDRHPWLQYLEAWRSRTGMMDKDEILII